MSDLKLVGSEGSACTCHRPVNMSTGLPVPDVPAWKDPRCPLHRNTCRHCGHHVTRHHSRCNQCDCPVADVCFENKTRRPR